MSGSKFKSKDYDPDEDIWDDRALIQAYNDAVKQFSTKYHDHEGDDGSEAESKRRKRSHSKSQLKSKSPANGKPNEEDEEVENGQDDAQDAGPDLTWAPVDISAMYPYGNPRSYPVNLMEGQSTPATSSSATKKADRPNKASSSSTTTSGKQSRYQTMETSEDPHNYDEDDDQHQEEEYDENLDEDWVESKTPASKRRKTSQAAPSPALHRLEYPYNQGWTSPSPYHAGPSGLQPPNMNSIPRGPTPPGAGPWWQQNPNMGWQHAPSMPQPAQYPDNATLWAYYYYGYAMGQYDAMKMLHSNNQSE